MKIRCLRNTSDGIAHEFTPGAAYEVIGIEAGDFRVIDDSGAPILAPPSLFEVADPARPAQWKSWHQDGAEYAYAPELARPGFFEDFHEREPSAVREFHRYINRHLRLSSAA
jgi:hypothetical protein